MKKRSIICLLLCLILLLPTSVYASEPDTTETVSESTAPMIINSAGGCNTLDATQSFFSKVEGIENAEAVVLYEVTTDTLMYTYNPDVQMYPSSLTKIMTTLVALENGNLNDEVTVRQEILNEIPIGAAIAGLYGDEVLTVETLLYSMMVDSANDSAAVLADHIAGSQEAFVKMMNDRAKEIGCTNTNFVNVHGLYDEAHLSTARDIAKIIKEAIQNEKFVDIFETVYYTMPATNKSEERGLVSGNFLMTRGDIQVYYDSRVTGGRTGVTPSGLRCIASTAESGNLQMISVVMGSESTMQEGSTAVKSFGGFQETTALLDCGFNGMSAKQVLFPGQVMKQYLVENGNNDLAVGPDVSAITILPDDVSSKDLTYRYTDLSANITAPIQKGQRISSVEILYNGSTVATADLFAMNSVDVKEAAPVNPQMQQKTSVVPVLLVGVGIMVVVIIFLFGSRYARRARLASRRRRVQNKHRRRN